MNACLLKVTLEVTPSFSQSEEFRIIISGYDAAFRGDSDKFSLLFAFAFTNINKLNKQQYLKNQLILIFLCTVVICYEKGQKYVLKG